MSLLGEGIPCVWELLLPQNSLCSKQLRGISFGMEAGWERIPCILPCQGRWKSSRNSLGFFPGVGSHQDLEQHNLSVPTCPPLPARPILGRKPNSGVKTIPEKGVGMVPSLPVAVSAAAGCSICHCPRRGGSPVWAAPRGGSVCVSDSGLSNRPAAPGCLLRENQINEPSRRRDRLLMGWPRLGQVPPHPNPAGIAPSPAPSHPSLAAAPLEPGWALDSPVTQNGNFPPFFFFLKCPRRGFPGSSRRRRRLD